VYAVRSAHLTAQIGAANSKIRSSTNWQGCKHQRPYIKRSWIPHPSYVRLDMAVGSNSGVGLDAVEVPAVKMVPVAN